MANTHSLKLQGKFELLDPLDIDTSYTLALEGSVTSISKHSQEDGNFEYVYALKPLRGEIVSKVGTVSKFEKKSSQSQKLRSRIRMDALSENKDPDVEYERLMTLLRHYWPEIKENLESLESVL